MKNKLNFYLVALVVLFSSLNMKGQNTLPSCVITAPHCNAYFQDSSDITILVYSTDFGGSYIEGSVVKMELFNGEVLLGELTTATSNTYSFLWTKVPSGTYTLTAKATDNDSAVSKSAGVIITVGSSPVVPDGLSACSGKYLANIISRSVPSGYNILWNGVTAENSCKWGSVEGTRDVMNWTEADKAYNHAKDNHLMFRYHALAWGSQYPQWITTLSPADFQVQMEEYMAAVAARYPLIDQIDVLNENMYLNTWNKKEHAAGTPYFRAGLGGPGITGYDWVIWLFEKARFYFPNSKLIMNDFELESNPAGINEMLDVVKVLRDRGLIDGFGTQAHYFNVDGITASALQNSLNIMDNSGVPIYVTELDLRGKTISEAGQLSSYKSSFPVYWNHAAVAGITLWGYVEEATWAEGTGIINSNGTERSAMAWLKTYMADSPKVGYPYCSDDIITDTLDNLLFNGEFDMNIYAWNLNNNNTGVGTMSIVTGAGMSGNNALEICPSAPGVANWEVQVSQQAPIVAGKKYLISFVAKADANRTITIAMQMAGSPYTLYLEELVSLTTTKQHFTFQFIPTKADVTNNLKFFVGTDATCLTIDSVVYKEIVDNYAHDIAEKPSFIVYPNPITYGKVKVSNKAGEMISSVQIIDIQGKVVKTVQPKTLNTEIDVSGLQKGVYYLRIHSEKTIINQKILIL